MKFTLLLLLVISTMSFAETIQFKAKVGLHQGIKVRGNCLWISAEPGNDNEYLDLITVELRPKESGGTFDGDLIGKWSEVLRYDSSENEVKFSVKIQRNFQADGLLTLDARIKLNNQKAISYSMAFDADKEMIFPRIEIDDSNKSCYRAVLILKGS